MLDTRGFSFQQLLQTLKHHQIVHRLAYFNRHSNSMLEVASSPQLLSFHCHTFYVRVLHHYQRAPSSRQTTQNHRRGDCQERHYIMHISPADCSRGWEWMQCTALLKRNSKDIQVFVCEALSSVMMGQHRHQAGKKPNIVPNLFIIFQ